MTVPDYVQTAYDEYKQASTDLKDFREEIGEVLNREEEMVRDKTRAKNTLTSSILKYKNESPEISNSLFEENITIYDDDDFEITDEVQAVTQIAIFCEKYFDKTGVDLRGSFYKILIGAVRERVLNDPSAFGLVDISQGEVKHWYSPGMEIKRVKKVRVSNSI